METAAYRSGGLTWPRPDTRTQPQEEAECAKRKLVVPRVTDVLVTHVRIREGELETYIWTSYSTYLTIHHCRCSWYRGIVRHARQVQIERDDGVLKLDI